MASVHAPTEKQRGDQRLPAAGLSEEAIPSPPRPPRDSVDGPLLHRAEQVVGSPEWQGEVPSSAGLFPSDPRAAFLLLNEARCRAIQGVFGVRRDQANLMTVIATMMLAEAVHAKTHRLRRRLRGPTRGGVLLAHGLVNGLGQEIAGPSSRDVPFFAPLIGTAAVGTVAVRVLRQSGHDMKSVSHRVKLSLRSLFDFEAGSPSA
jgi:hypothetical protein